MASQPAFRRAEPEARRLELIEACARVLAREGASGASVRAIAAEAGVSPGLVGHYFEGVDALVAATYAQVGATVDAALDSALTQAGPAPHARLEAYLTASFTPAIARPELLATWVAFWSLTVARADIARQHAEQYAGFRARLEDLLGECGMAREHRRRQAIALTALVDGLWLELCLAPDVIAPAEAEAIVRAAAIAAIL